MEGNEAQCQIAQALADPLRLHILRHLNERPATVSELQAITGESQSKISNHLAILRERKLVTATRQCRQMVYELHDTSVTRLLAALSLVGAEAPQQERTISQLAIARTCYDHLAGRVGTALKDALLQQDALIVIDDTWLGVQPGSQAQTVFARLDIDLAAARRERRHLVKCCRDWTEHRWHVGGALGAALLAQFIKRGWVEKQEGTRAVTITDEGKQQLQVLFGLPANVYAGV
ncbi:ArsR family transcriptional regulator [Ktedonosporobacter rubrisoli]|uniref:ArsR family transcriptional regulator n=1 Tax=Ktedonosporobacter rubrisoli TaxID=2509675 RepID=A0A4P6JM22_KTERU|nr:metalloregulator ArsR/SmtB family transcription factor [Ktedonosporobacter rubrisoli]QBD76275.1 ArsR family transcriptional regulator [Ktedonosporobacter rubrisoli]